MSEGANILDQELENLARRLAQDIARANARKHEEQSRYLIFRSRAVRFRLPLEIVREVLLPLPLYRVPRAPEAILGVMNHRGRVVTVLDWAMLLPWGFIPADQAGELRNQEEQRDSGGNETRTPLVDQRGVLGVEESGGSQILGASEDSEDPLDTQDTQDSQDSQNTLPRSEEHPNPAHSFDVALGFEGAGDCTNDEPSFGRIERPGGKQELGLLPKGREQDLRFVLLDLFGNELGIKVDQVESISTQGNVLDSGGTELSEGYSIKPELLSEWIEALMA